MTSLPTSRLPSLCRAARRLAWIAAALPTIFAAWAVAAEAKRPNVVFILSDDQNFDTLACFGGKVLTPNIDRIASQGVKFSRAYSVSSVCTPSRYICLSGQYASRCTSDRFLKMCPPGQPSNVGFNVQITPGSLNVARVLKDAGYATGFVGKWHTGTPPILPYPPDADIKDPKIARILAENQERMCDYIRRCGFDYAASVYRGNLADHKLDALVSHNMEWVTQGALAFLEKYNDRPFFLHICPTLQHGPPPEKSIPGDPRLTPAGLLAEAPQVQAPRASIAPRLAKYGIAPNMGHATWLDDAVGAVMKKLEDLGVADNTVIVFFSDNATRGGKGTCYQGGIHVPALISLPGRIGAGQTCDRLVANLDVVPTILDLCGVQSPEAMKIDGRSLAPLVRNTHSEWRDELLLEIGHTRGIVTPQWKYVALRYPPALQAKIAAKTLQDLPYHMGTSLDLQRRAEQMHPAYWDADQLYDLSADPQEKTNLAKDPKHAQTLAEMKGRLGVELKELSRPFGEFHPRTPTK